MAAPSSFGRALRVLAAVTCMLPLVPACGGRSDTEDYLFGSDGTITVGASSNRGGSNATSGFGTGGSGPAAGMTSNAGVGSSLAMGGSVSVAGQPSFGGVPGGGFGTGGTALGGVGSAGAPAGPPITCGSEVCDSSVQTCCFGGFSAFTCLDLGQTCNGAVLGCTTKADCNGDVCCLSVTGDSDAASSCKARCDNMGSGRDRQLCESDADCQMPFRFCTPTVFGVNICTRRP